MNIRRIVAATLIAGVLTLSVTAQAEDEETIHLKPQSPWQLDYADARCRLGRFFGEGEDRTVFWLEQYGPREGFTWLVAGPAIDRFRARRNTKIQFGPIFPEWEFEYPSATLEGFGDSISGRGPDAAVEDGEAAANGRTGPIGLPHLDEEAGREILWLRLEQKSRPPVIFELGRMDKPFEAVNQCMEDLVSHWGVDVEAQKTRATLPQLTNIHLVARRIQEHYPSKAARSGSQANFHLRILVGADGRPTDCTLTGITLAKNFDMRDHPCQIALDTAEFEPARDVNGRAIASFYETSILYRIGS